MTRKLYQQIVSTLEAIKNCEQASNYEWKAKHEHTLEILAKEYLPSGSGIDSGTQIVGMKNGNLILLTEFHHMNETGYYDGWTPHTITVKPCLLNGYDLMITGSNRNEIKDYLMEVFTDALNREIELPRKAYESTKEI